MHASMQLYMTTLILVHVYVQVYKGSAHISYSVYICVSKAGSEVRNWGAQGNVG